jgi:transposase InsO family protein
MPWKECGPMSERMGFVARLLAGERMSELCREFGISRKTGYKFKERYDRLGPHGLYDVSRRPKRSPGRTPRQIEELIIELRKVHPTWGPKKLVGVLERIHPGLCFPAVSTAGDMLARKGLVRRRRRRHTVFTLGRGVLRDAKSPNEVWCADYKGQFRLGNGRYCYPLTITDQASRFLLGCEGFERIDGDSARAVFEDRFSRYGLPEGIRTDNGPPFASRGLFGLTRLSVFWLKLGIALERIQPGKPQQNGRHERMHKTLKEDTTRPAASNLLQQQERFDHWVATFNEIRPHEALDQKTPATVYSPSPRRATAAPLEYPLHDDIRTVHPSGHIRLLRGRKYPGVFLSAALATERVGIRELEDGRWLVSFATLDLGWIDSTASFFQPADAAELPE